MKNSNKKSDGPRQGTATQISTAAKKQDPAQDTPRGRQVSTVAPAVR